MTSKQCSFPDLGRPEAENHREVGMKGGLKIEQIWRIINKGTYIGYVEIPNITSITIQFPRSRKTGG